LIEVPVSVVGEASGSVSIQSDKGIKGEGRLIVCIYDMAARLVAKTITEHDGYFSYLGLPPGIYTASVDSNQLKKLNMTSAPSKPFQINGGKEGDVADGLDLVLIPVLKEARAPANDQ
jgi:hypothetical protein